jgi:predicted PurR-regulated permease PerM
MNPILIITPIGFHVLDILLSLNLPKEIKLLISHLSDGMENLKFGTPTSKSKTHSKLMMPISMEFLSLLTENTSPLEEKIKNYISGILKIFLTLLETLILVLLSSKSPSTPNFNGLLPVLNKESKSGI